MSNHTGTKPERLQHFEWAPQVGDRHLRVPFGVARVRKGKGNEVRLTCGQVPEASAFVTGLKADMADRRSESEALVYTRELQPLATGESKSRSRRLQKQLTRYAKRTIKEGCAVMKDEAEKPGAFLTATVPGSTKLAMTTVAEHSHRLMNDITEKLRKAHSRFPRSNGENIPDMLLTVVWEPQKRGMLHLHAVMAIDDKDLYKYVKANWQKWWRQCLENLSDATGVDLFQRAEGGTWRNTEMYPRVECRRVKRDIGKYLSKYIAKGADGSQEPDDEGLTRWWYMSRPLLNLVKAHRQETKIPTACMAVAEKLLLDLVELAMPFEPDVFESKHPKFGTPCGYILYVDQSKADDVFIRMSEFLTAKENEYQRSPWQWNEAGEYSYDERAGNAAEESGWINFDDEEEGAGCAALVAPFSS